MNAALSRIGNGFTDTTHGAQQAFRTLLDAMARPGRVLDYPPVGLEGLQADEPKLAPPVGAGLAATLLTLLDATTSVCLCGSFQTEETAAWVRFHTGARAAPADGSPVDWAVAPAGAVDDALLARLELGTDIAPQDGATLIIEVEGIDAAAGIDLRLRGPGIESVGRLCIAGLPMAFWTWRKALQARMPRGVDLVLVQGTRIAALPRSTRIEPVEA